MNIDLTLRVATLVLLIIWRLYWYLTAKKAMLNKPKIDFTKRTAESMWVTLLGAYVVVNLFGYVLFPFNNFLFVTIGFILVILSFSQAISARKKLADNWTESYEYQIKKNHELITNGIYKYVRHPIYGALLIMPTGALIVSGSYTFIVCFIFILFAIEIFAKREEKLLTKHFGKKYIEYKKTTKKFIPFIY
ncbi:MAG: isoprenylcysteine carboxylmethyltransferase family protein [Patescibacteria group bacterium]|jgi:protein-S-isoprenylcysteine O-methyltransferase Ste14